MLHEDLLYISGARRLTVPIHKYQFHYEPQAAINEKEIRVVDIRNENIIAKRERITHQATSRSFPFTKYS